MKLFLFTLSFSLFILSLQLHAGDEGAQALYEKGRELDTLSESLTEKAEKACYWGKSGSHDCMENFVKQYNAKYGAGSFELLPQLNVIRYTGIHFKQLMEKYPKSDYAAAAEYDFLTKDLVGLPDIILAKVQGFIDHYPSGEWNRKGKLLFARLNQDIWWIHKNWSWIIYNGQVSEAELLRRSERYREEALRIFKGLMAGSKTEEGEAASKEYELLKKYKDDGRIYGITNESLVGTKKTNP